MQDQIYQQILSAKKPKSELERVGRKSLRAFYADQNDLIDALSQAEARLARIQSRRGSQSVPQDSSVIELSEADRHEQIRIDDHDDLESTDNRRSQTGPKLAIMASFCVNLILFGAKLLASILTGSLLVVASTLDSALDLLAGGIIFFTHRSARKRSYDGKYPVGKLRLENLGILIFAAVMCTASFQIVLEAVQFLIAQHDSESDNYLVAMIILGATIGIKLTLFVVCKYYGRVNMTCETLAQDHRNDSLTNGFAVMVLILRYYIPNIWYLDPIGAICLSLFIIASWILTGHYHLTLLVGRVADNRLKNAITYFVYRFDSRIKYVDTVRAYHSGEMVIVEVDIILPADTTLKESHDLGECLQNALESFEEVQRAFVHADYEFEIGLYLKATFKSSDISHDQVKSERLKSSVKKKLLDTPEHVLNTLEELGYPHEVDIQNNHVRRLAWLNEHMIYALETYGDVTVMDTTYSKNRWGVPIACIVVLDEENRLRLGAIALLDSEDTAAFKWFLNWLTTVTKWSPKVVFSDGDLAIANALESLNATHFLCLFHLIKNMKKNCAGRNIDINKFVEDFLKVQRCTTEESFAREWVALKERYPSCNDYLTRNLDGCMIRKWATFYLSYSFTLNLCTTSIVESFNAKLSRVLNSKTPIIELINKVSKITENTYDYKSSPTWNMVGVLPNTESIAKMTRFFGRPVIEQLQLLLTNFAFNMLMAQMSSSVLFYDIDEKLDSPIMDGDQKFVLDNDAVDGVAHSFFNEVYPPQPFDSVEAVSDVFQVFKVSSRVYRPRESQPVNMVTIYRDSTYDCTCGLICRIGIPCRHYLAIVALKRCVAFVPAAIIHTRWIRSGSDIQVMDDIPGFRGSSNFTIPASNIWYKCLERRREMSPPMETPPKLQYQREIQHMQTEARVKMKKAYNAISDDPEKLVRFTESLEIFTYVPAEPVLKDPVVKKTKGAPVIKRKMSMVDSALGKKRGRKPANNKSSKEKRKSAKKD